MGWYGDPDHLDELARRLDGLAVRTEEVGDRLAATVAALPWHSPAAAAFRRRAEDRRREIRSDADALRHAAGETRALADQVRSELAGLRRTVSALPDRLRELLP